MVFGADWRRFAYVEFAEASHVQAAEALNESLFRGRMLKVCCVVVHGDD